MHDEVVWGEKFQPLCTFGAATEKVAVTLAAVSVAIIKKLRTFSCLANHLQNVAVNRPGSC
jgi:hypothetical protein